MPGDQATATYGLTWDDIGRCARQMAAAIEREGRPDVMLGVVRGGWVPAVLLAHLLKVRDVRAIEVTHTIEDVVLAAKSPAARVRNPASMGDLRGADVLIVDDVVGTGMTLAATCDLVKAGNARRIRTAVCVVNESNWSTSSHRATELTHVGSHRHGWVVFPWELT